MRFIKTTLVLSSLVVLACQPLVKEPSLEDQLQALVDAVVADNEIVFGAALHVDSSASGFKWEGAAGQADPAAGTPMTPFMPVRIASNTKTFIAAAVLRLAEEGALGLDDPIADHLGAEHTAMLTGDEYDVEAMTIRHLLTHTSGLFEHSGLPSYTERIVEDPTHQWTRTEQLSWAVERGDPHAAPGQIYTYCDTGYVLLGEIIEQTAGRPMADAVRDLVGYSNEGMNSTWWEIHEEPPVGTAPRAHQFFGALDVYSFEPYFDLYGGGGVVATVGDMARFWRGIFSNRVFSKPETLETMLTTFDGLRALPEASARALPPGAYRMGLWEVEVEGMTGYRHTGFWGTSATYVPELDLVVTLTVNQNQCGTLLEDLPRDVIRLLKEKSTAG